MRAARRALIVALPFAIAVPAEIPAGAASAGAPGSSCVVAGAPAGLSGAAALSSSDAWAVGSYFDGTATQTLAEHWNGTAWCPVPSPNPGGSANRNELLSAAALSSSNAWAAGFYNTTSGATRTLTLHWDGTAWTKVPSPNRGGNGVLRGVASTSSSDAWAAGDYYNSTSGATRTLILHWDGTAWTKVPSPNPGGAIDDVLDGVAASSSADAWAVGDYYSTTLSKTKTLILHWDGTKWSKIASPSPSCPAGGISLTGVAAASSANAWAVGACYKNSGVQTLILHWDGTAWSKVPSPNPGGSRGSALGAVTVTPNSPGAWAVGSYGIGTLGATQSLILRWDGTAWTQIPSPDPGGTAGANLMNAVTALSPSSAWAAGKYSTSLTANGSTLVEHWDGTAWTQQASP